MFNKINVILKNEPAVVRSEEGRQGQGIEILWMFFLILGLFLTLSACGKKAPPYLPQKAFGAKVVNLQAEYQNNVLLLKGQIQGLNGLESPETQVSGCRVYYVQYPLEKKPCSGCPIEFRDYQQFGPEVVNKEGFVCQIPDIQTGQIYYFKVLLIGPDGYLGPVSERISIEIR
ncbi:MAG: hypothetical protein EHM45_21235 [Desulfobacteraceae bacterium]|nr:MAG: hypothetical protein EHM45_21235 [Desulfobacteraceae bacterium]